MSAEIGQLRLIVAALSAKLEEPREPPAATVKTSRGGTRRTQLTPLPVFGHWGVAVSGDLSGEGARKRLWEPSWSGTTNRRS
nr:hypothetical protein BaRGS_021134 [Batillaria attramentaria]